MTPRPPAPARFARVRRAEVFAAALRSPARAHTPHFALHHLAAVDAGPAGPGLSTTVGTSAAAPVDNLPVATADAPRAIGVVVPKRHARRAVTRNLLRRQVYAVAERHGGHLGGGCWIVRLRTAFPVAAFPSAASTALKTTARGELVELIDAASRSAPSSASPS